MNSNGYCYWCCKIWIALPFEQRGKTMEQKKIQYINDPGMRLLFTVNHCDRWGEKKLKSATSQTLLAYWWRPKNYIIWWPVDHQYFYFF